MKVGNFFFSVTGPKLLICHILLVFFFLGCLHLCEISQKKRRKTSKIKSPITKHILIIEQLSIFSSFLNQIELFLNHWTPTLEATNVFGVSEVNTQK
jgi:hypothetical protein